MTFATGEIKVCLKLDKIQTINLINTVLKNTGVNEFLSEDVDEKRIVEVVESMYELELAQSDFVNTQNANSFNVLGASLMLNDTWEKEQYNSIDIMSIEYKSDTEIIIKLWDSKPYDGKYQWLSVAYNIDCKECIIDELEVEYSKWFQDVWHKGTHFIRKENGSFHYDYYSAENYQKLMEEGIHTIHFGESLLYDLDNQLYNLHIELEAAEGEHKEQIRREIKQKESEIEDIKEKVLKISGMENDSKLIYRLNNLLHNYEEMFKPKCMSDDERAWIESIKNKSHKNKA